MNWYHVPITNDGSLWIEIEAESVNDATNRAENIDDHGLLTIHPSVEKPVKKSPYYDEAIRLFPETLPEPPAFVIRRPFQIDGPTFGVAYDGMGFHYSDRWYRELVDAWKDTEEEYTPDMPISEFIAAIEEIGYRKMEHDDDGYHNPSWRYPLSGGRYAGVMFFGSVDYDIPAPIPFAVYVCKASGHFEDFGETVAANFGAAIDWLKKMAETDGRG